MQETISALKRPLSGLVSISFRKLSPSHVVDLAASCGLDGIEWGGDIHVPHGDLGQAREVRLVTAAAGLQSLAYGSYYKLGESEASGLSFDRVLETAVALETPLIRVWAGSVGSAEADEVKWHEVCWDAERVASLAGEAGVKVGVEFHGESLNDSPAGARRFWKELQHPNLHSLWQPLLPLSDSDKEESLKIVMDRLCQVHVFHWRPDWEPRPLSEGTDEWKRWFGLIGSQRPSTPALLEFIVGDDPANLPADAATLKAMLGAS